MGEESGEKRGESFPGSFVSGGGVPELWVIKVLGSLRSAGTQRVPCACEV